MQFSFKTLYKSHTMWLAQSGSMAWQLVRDESLGKHMRLMVSYRQGLATEQQKVCLVPRFLTGSDN